MMRKSSGVSIVLLAAAATSGVPARGNPTRRERTVSAEAARIERGRFGHAVEGYWPFVLFGAVAFLLIRTSGGE
jgi:hypothetical protein